MKEIGEKEKHVEKENLSFLINQYMKDPFLIIVLTDSVLIQLKIVHIKGNGKMINRMGQEKKHGKTKVNIKVNICKGKKTDLENMFGQTEAIMMENGVIIRWRGKENFIGQMADNIKEIGKTA